MIIKYLVWKFGNKVRSSVISPASIDLSSHRCRRYGLSINTTPGVGIPNLSIHAVVNAITRTHSPSAKELEQSESTESQLQSLDRCLATHLLRCLCRLMKTKKNGINFSVLYGLVFSRQGLFQRRSAIAISWRSSSCPTTR